MSKHESKQAEKGLKQQALDFAERTRSAHEALVQSLRTTKAKQQAA